MRKKYWIITAAAVVLAGAAFLVTIELNGLQAPLIRAIARETGSEVRIGRVEYRAFNRIVLHTLVLGDYLSAARVTVWINPVRGLRHLHDRASFIGRIDIEKPSLFITPQLRQTISTLSARKKRPSIVPVHITLSGGRIDSYFTELNDISADIIAAAETAGTVQVRIGSSSRLTMGIHAQSSQEQNIVRLSARMRSAAADIDAVGDLRLSSAGSTLHVSAPALRFDGYTCNGAEIRAQMHRGAVTGSLVRGSSRITFEGNTASSVTIAGTILMNELRRDATGSFNLSSVCSRTAVAAALTGRDVRFGSVEYGDISASLSGAPHRWIADIRSVATGLTIVSSFDNGSINTTLNRGKTRFGTISGTVRPLRLEGMVDMLPVVLVPGLESRFDGLQGAISGTATLTSESYHARLYLNRLRMRKTPIPLSATLEVSRQKHITAISLTTLQHDLTAHFTLGDDRQWTASIAIARYSAQSIVPWFYPGMNVSGTVSGSAMFDSSSRNGHMDVRVNEPAVNNIVARSGEAVAEWNPQQFVLKRFYVRSSSGTLNASGTVSLSDTRTGSAQFMLASKNFTAGSLRFNGITELQGALSKGTNWDFTGQITGKDLALNSMKPQRLAATLRCSGRQVQISEIELGMLARGQIFLNLAEKTIQAALDVTGLDIGDVSSGIPGLTLPITASVAVRGSLAAPEATVRISSGDGSYRGIPFACSGTFFLSGFNRVRCENTVARSGRSVVTLNGGIYPALSCTAVLQNVSCSTIATVLGSSVACSGEAYGRIVVAGTAAAPRADASVTIRDAAVGRLRAGEVRADVNADRAGVQIRSGLIKTAASEMRFKKGSSIDLSGRAYKAIFEVVGMRAGSVDLFTSTCVVKGAWKVSGRMLTSIDADLQARSVWLNKTMIPSVNASIVYRGNEITFAPGKSTGLAMSGTIAIPADGSMSFRGLSLTHTDSGSSVEMNGTIRNGNANLRCSARALDAELCADILELPFSARGKVAADVSLSGSLEQPACDVSFHAVNGSVAGLPFDRASLSLSARQDVLTIVQAEMVSAAHYTLSASGYAPFALTASGKKRIQNNPVDVTVSLQKGSLSALRYLVKGVSSASGDVHAQMRMNGTLARPSGTGYLKVNKGVISSESYIRDIKGLVIDCLWKNNSIVIRDVHGRSGGGDIRARGSIIMDGIRPKALNISVKTATQAGIPVVIPQLPIPSPSPVFKTERIKMLTNYSHGEPRFDVLISGPWEEPVIDGFVELANTRFSFPPETKPVAAVRVPGKPSRLKLNLELRTGKNCWYDNALVSVNIQGAITLKGKAASPVVDGHIEAVRGNIVYLGSEFTIKQAALDIARDICYLSGEAETDVGNITANDVDTIRLVIDKAEIFKIQPRFISKNNPDMAPEKAMALAVDVNAEGGTSEEIAFKSRRALIRLIDASLTTPLAMSLLKRSGVVDTFKVSYRSGDTTITPATQDATIVDYLKGTSYTVGKNLGSNVNLGYTLTLDQVQNKLDLRHDLELSYYLQKNLMIKGAYQLENRTDTRDPDRRLTIEHKLKFGTPGK